MLNWVRLFMCDARNGMASHIGDLLLPDHLNGCPSFTWRLT